jgi:hypothetical protein
MVTRGLRSQSLVYLFLVCFKVLMSVDANDFLLWDTKLNSERMSNDVLGTELAACSMLLSCIVYPMVLKMEVIGSPKFHLTFTRHSIVYLKMEVLCNLS